MKVIKFILFVSIIAFYSNSFAGYFYMNANQVFLTTNYYNYKTPKEILSKNLPAAVKGIITKKFGKKVKLINAQKIIDKNKTTFKIRLVKGEDTYELVTDAKGKILLLKKLIQYDESEEEMGC